MNVLQCTAPKGLRAVQCNLTAKGARPARPASRQLGGLPFSRRARSLQLKEAASTDQIEAEAEAKQNGSNGSNGNGAASSSTAPVVVIGEALPAASNGNGSSSSSSNGEASNGAAAASSRPLAGSSLEVLASAENLKSVDALSSIEGDMDPCAAGQLEACAMETLAERERREAQRAAEAAPAPPAPAKQQQQQQPVASTSAPASEAAAAPSTAAGTPYVAPGGRWSQFKSYSTWQRTCMIWGFALQFFFKLWLTGRPFAYKGGKKGMTPEAVSAKKSELAVWLREGLVRLGPTFIKIGQQFSTRVDVLAPEFIKELEKLQDNVPAFDSATALGIVERGLGRPVGEVFEEFDPQPIAAASLGQVHVAKVQGKRVVVKVQRPGLKELFDIDLKNVRVLAQWLQAVDPKSDGAARDWVAIYDECSRILYQEIDYTLEAESAERFRKCFEACDWIKVPTIYWDYTTPEVLTMEYTPGVKINRVEELDAMGIDRQRLARLAVECYLQQLLTHGFFHADPHPGNIAVDSEGGGRLIYYDFGMMGTIPSDVRGGLLELFYGVYNKDPDRCLDALVAMGVLVPGGDRTAVRRTADFFLRQFQERLDAQRAERKANKAYGASFKPQATKEDKAAKRKQILSSIGEDLLVASADKPFRFPATFTFVVRSFTVLDGIGKALDPRFDMTEIAAPYARELLLEGQPQYAKARAEFGKALARQNRAVVNLFKGPNMIEDTAATIRSLERGDLKLRVRALEAERALSRVAGMQRAMLSAVVASMLVNVGTVLSVSAMAAAANVSFAAAAVCGLATLANWLKVKSQEKKEAQLTGAA